MNVNNDRLTVLIAQFDRAYEIAKARLDGFVSPASLPEDAELTKRQAGGNTLTDEEYLWRPTANTWTIHPRSEITTSKAFGAGDWVLDNESFDPDPAPVATIAWRIGHLHSTFAGRLEWTFGGRHISPKELVDFSPSADKALAQLWSTLDEWREKLLTLTDEQLDQIGFGQYPNGSDPEEPFISVIWWTNLELIHHMAEIALLRDLWRERLI